MIYSIIVMLYQKMCDKIPCFLLITINAEFGYLRSKKCRR